MGYFSGKIVDSILIKLENSEIFDKLMDRFVSKLSKEINVKQVSSSQADLGFSTKRFEEDDFDSMSAIAKAAGSLTSNTVRIDGGKFDEKVVKTDNDKNKQTMDLLNNLGD